MQPVQRRRRALAPASRRSAVIAAAAGAADAEVVDLKMALLDSFWGTERGLAASSDSRAEINELITQVGCCFLLLPATWPAGVILL